MPLKDITAGLAGVVLVLALAATAAAQPLGVRASGLAEAFVAVADDATSVYWNPAGMATSAYMSFVVDYGHAGAEPEAALSPDGGFSQNVGVIAFTIPPLGLSYYRLSTVVTEPLEAAVTGSPDRQEGRRIVHGLATSNVGLTVAQSVNQYLVVAGTVRYVHGVASSGAVPALSAGEAIDMEDLLDRRESSRVDVDAGVMAAVEHLR